MESHIESDAAAEHPAADDTQPGGDLKVLEAERQHVSIPSTVQDADSATLPRQERTAGPPAPCAAQEVQSHEDRSSQCDQRELLVGDGESNPESQKGQSNTVQQGEPLPSPDNDPPVQISSIGDIGSEDMASDNGDDMFSNYGSEDSASFYSSLRSFATDYYWENGRRYHSHQGGRYMLPNDETELDREDMKHHEWMVITECRLHIAPIGPNPQRILDVGTGTGIWAMQAAECYPGAEVIGTDISPVQPKWVPPNLTFEIDDLEAEWLYRPGSFDLINVRFMFLAVKDFPALLAQAYKSLKPGGYVELSELATLPEPTNPNYRRPVHLYRWLDSLTEASRRIGFNMRIAPTFKELVINAGFEDVVETKFEVPWGTWPEDERRKTAGFWHLEQLKQGLQGIVMGLFTRSLGWSPEQVEVFLVDLRKELDDKNYHLLDHAYVVYGRKPLT